MSVRAYKVIEIKHEEGESFNLWHDQLIMDFLEHQGCLSTLNCDGCGFITLDMAQMKALLAIAPSETFEQLQKDYGLAVASKQDYIEYLCF